MHSSIILYSYLSLFIITVHEYLVVLQKSITIHIAN